MASFIGSNLQTLHYNFKHKIAGSTVENPLKIYSGSVNPSNLPAPTSNEWKEIKNQNFIDRLGQQDGNTVVETTNNSVMGNIVSTNAPCDGMMNVEIGGNTLKNEISKSTVTTAFGGESVTLIKSTNRTVAIPNHVKVNPNLTYSLIINIKNRTNSTQYLGTQILQGSSSKSISGNINATGRYIITFTPIDSSDLGLYLFIASSDNDNAIYEISSDIMILEGDWTNKPIPSYFDGIKSVGELEGNKIEALSCGKNLVNREEELVDTMVGMTANLEPYPGVSTMRDYILVRENESLMFSKDGAYSEDNHFRFAYYGQDKKTVILRLAKYTNNFESIVPNNAKYLRVSYPTSNKIQIERGTTATEYEPYKEDKLNILTTAPLRGLPNGVRDIGSGDTVERKIGKAVLNGDVNEKWYNNLPPLSTTNCFVISIPHKINLKSLCDKFIQYNSVSTVDLEGFAQNGPQMYFRILKSKLTQYGYIEGTTSTYIPAFKAWLQANPTTVYYELAEPTIEKLSQPLTLQSFANGTLQVNTAIPPYIKEYHTTNEDDKGVMQYQSGTTGLSQAFLTQIPLSSITNDIFGGSLPALKSAYKLTSNCDISAYGSGDNNGVKTNNVTYKAWNGTEYVLLNTSTSNVVSNINNILNNSNYVVDNNIYILMHTLPASDTIKSQINLDYFNANIDIGRQPDNVVIPETVKNTYIPTNYTIFTQVACLITNNKKIITQYYKDDNNYIELNVENNKVNFVKCVNGVTVTLSSNNLDYGKYQVIGIIAQQQNTGMKLSVLKNNGECEHFSNTDVNILNVATEWKLGHDINITNQLDGFVVDYQFMARNFTNTECEVMLKGRNTTGDITYDSFVKDYQNGKIQSGFILPNNKYKIIGQVKLYYNDSYSRTVQDCEFVAKDDENKVELIGMAELVRVD